MWMVASFVLRNQKSPHSDAEKIRKLNSIDVRIFAGHFADKVKELGFQFYGGRMLVRISDNQREEILDALRVEDPLSRAAEYDGLYFLGKELYAAINEILPESKKNDESLPLEWLTLVSAYGETKVRKGDKPVGAQPNEGQDAPREANENAATAITTEPPSRTRGERRDPMRTEIESAIQELGDQPTPNEIMNKLKSYAGKDGSCITKAGSKHVVWCKASGDLGELDMGRLRKRLARRSHKGNKPG